MTMENPKSTPIFPDDFTYKSHRIVPGASQWTLKDNDDDVVISVVGGSGLYGDGVNTFEMYDFREDEPQGYLSEDEINEHLKANPL
jgi:hypothetical protein